MSTAISNDSPKVVSCRERRACLSGPCRLRACRHELGEAFVKIQTHQQAQARRCRVATSIRRTMLLRRDPFAYLLVGIPVLLDAYKVVNPIAGRRLAQLQLNRLDDVVHGAVGSARRPATEDCSRTGGRFLWTMT